MRLMGKGHYYGRPQCPAHACAAASELILAISKQANTVAPAVRNVHVEQRALRRRSFNPEKRGGSKGCLHRLYSPKWGLRSSRLSEAMLSRVGLKKQTACAVTQTSQQGVLVLGAWFSAQPGFS